MSFYLFNGIEHLFIPVCVQKLLLWFVKNVMNIIKDPLFPGLSAGQEVLYN